MYSPMQCRGSINLISSFQVFAFLCSLPQSYLRVGYIGIVFYESNVHSGSVAAY